MKRRFQLTFIYPNHLSKTYNNTTVHRWRSSVVDLLQRRDYNPIYYNNLHVIIESESTHHIGVMVLLEFGTLISKVKEI